MKKDREGGKVLQHYLWFYRTKIRIKLFDPLRELGVNPIYLCSYDVWMISRVLGPVATVVYDRFFTSLSLRVSDDHPYVFSIRGNLL